MYLNLFLRLQSHKHLVGNRRDPVLPGVLLRGAPHASSDETRDLLEPRLGVRGPSDAVVDHRGALQRGIPRPRVLQDAIGLQVARPENRTLRDRGPPDRRVIFRPLDAAAVPDADDGSALAASAPALRW